MRIRATLRTSKYFRSILEIYKRIRVSLCTNLLPSQLLRHHLERFQVDCIIDVGANVGQFGVDMRRIGYSGIIHSFEPSQTSFKHLKRTSSSHSPWHVHMVALGEEAGIANLNLASNDGLSSSILIPAEFHDIYFPRIEFENNAQAVQIIKLDSKANLFSEFKNSFLKLDVQGFELEVLKGSTEILKSVRLLLIEMSFVKLYDSQPDFNSIHTFITEKSFRLIDITDSLRVNGELIQADFLYAKNSTITNS